MGKYNYAKVTIIVFIIFTVSCNYWQTNEKDFYKEKMADYDVWRFPIVEPFEMITAYCCTGWKFRLPDDFEASLTYISISPDSINYQKGNIIVSGVEMGINWGVVDMENKKFIAFKERYELIEYLSQRKIVPELIATDSAYQIWIKTGKLPWHEEIFQM